MIVVCGVPGSGASWIANVLSCQNEVTLYREPDNEHHNLTAFVLKQKELRFPYYRESDPPKNNLYKIYDQLSRGNFLHGYGRFNMIAKLLFDINEERVEKGILERQHLLRVSGGGSFHLSPATHLKLTPLRVACKLGQLFNMNHTRNRFQVVKSVHSLLSLPYIQHHFNPEIVLVLRHPANIVLSQIKMNNHDIWRNIFEQKRLVNDWLKPFTEKVEKLDHPLARAGAQTGAFYHILENQLRENTGWIVARHEHFCRNPHLNFHLLYNKLGLHWTDHVAGMIDHLNSKGNGNHTRRIAVDQIDKWKKALTKTEIDHIREGYSIFNSSFYPDFI